MRRASLSRQMKHDLENDRHCAAITIERMWRGKKAREAAHKRENAIVMIQRAERRHSIDLHTKGRLGGLGKQVDALRYKAKGGQGGPVAQGGGGGGGWGARAAEEDMWSG